MEHFQVSNPEQAIMAALSHSFSRKRYKNKELGITFNHPIMEADAGFDSSDIQVTDSRTGYDRRLETQCFMEREIAREEA